MSGEFRVSVVTPVYNAAEFLRRSVVAAVSQDEVGEVILIEDDSPDDSLVVCIQLAEEFDKVRLLQHPDKKNHGAGASRNLGILSSRFDYIAFSDADNFYLPNRFSRDKEIFLSDDTVDGVYGGEGIHYLTERSREIFVNNVDGDLADHEFLSLSAPCPPEELVYVWLQQHPTIRGEFGMDAITVRKTIFQKSGLFEPSLRLQQDHDLFTRFAAVGRLVPGVIDRPIAVRGVHEHQRMTDMAKQRIYARKRMDHLRGWFLANATDSAVLEAVEKAYWKFRLLQSRGFSAVYPTIRATWAHGMRESMQAYGLYEQGCRNVIGRGFFSDRVLSVQRRLLSYVISQSKSK